MNCDIVVAHYKENVDEWINKVEHKNIRNIFLYSKNSSYIPSPKIVQNIKINHQYLPNIGRESHTYLTYCIDHYSNLPDFVIFLQGFSACHGVTLAILNSWLNQIEQNNIKYTNNYKISHLYTGLKDGRRKSWKGKTELSRLSMMDWFNFYIKNPINNIAQSRIYFGAVFGVSKDKILSRSLDEYKNLLLEFQTINPEACHFIERSWYYWFNLDK